MLQSLVIKNLALLDAVELDFTAGFQAVTGETGAGKSVLLGALTLLSGSRADKGIIRSGQDQCVVEATLLLPEDSPIYQCLEEFDLPPCEDGCLLIKRSIYKNKPGRQQINGSQVTVHQLQQLGEFWIDFHGPQEPHKLFHEEIQLQFLDSYAGLEKDLSEYANRYNHWRSLQKELKTLQQSEKLSTAEYEFVQEQIEKISSLTLDQEYIESLERDASRLSQAQDLSRWSESIMDLLTDGDQSVLDKLQKSTLLADKIQLADSAGIPLRARLESLQLEVNDLSAEYADLQQSMDFSDEDVARIQEEMNIWQSLSRTYGTDIEIIQAKKEELQTKLAMQGDIEGLIFQKEQQIEKAAAQVFSQAQTLFNARAKAGKKLEKIVISLLAELGFKKARFSVHLTAIEKMLSTGNTECSFLFSSNPGSELQPLAKVASSGEMARMMLALKSILAQADHTPVLVFDEIDANVGGEIGKVVGKKLVELAKGRQVFCITHLPQVAGLTEMHWKVEKHQNDHSTSIEIHRLEDPEQRVEELARMLGDRHSVSAQEHARELLTSH